MKDSWPFSVSVSFFVSTEKWKPLVSEDFIIIFLFRVPSLMSCGFLRIKWWKCRSVRLETERGKGRNPKAPKNQTCGNPHPHPFHHTPFASSSSAVYSSLSLSFSLLQILIAGLSAGLLKCAQGEEGFCSAPNLNTHSNSQPLYWKVTNPTLSPVHLQGP